MTKFLAILMLAATVVSAAPATAKEGERNARDVYYERADPDLDPDKSWIGVRSSILLTYEDGEGTLQAREVSDLEEFRSEDRFRLRIQANIDGYLYVFVKDSQGDVKMLFPYEEGKTNRVKRFRTRSVPEQDWFRFDKNTGPETVYLFLSARPIRQLERAAEGGSRRFSERDLRSLLEDAGDSPSMIFDEASLADGGDIGATFYVEKPRSQDDYLVRTFNLKHR